MANRGRQWVPGVYNGYQEYIVATRSRWWVDCGYYFLYVFERTLSPSVLMMCLLLENCSLLCEQESVVLLNN